MAQPKLVVLLFQRAANQFITMRKSSVVLRGMVLKQIILKLSQGITTEFQDLRKMVKTDFMAREYQLK